MSSGPSYSAPSRPSQSVATSSFSQTGTSTFGASMGMSTPSYGMAGLSSGNTGMGSGMAGFTGTPGMSTGMTGLSMPSSNSGMAGLSTSGMNSGMTGLSSSNPTLSGSFGMTSAGASPWYSPAGSSAGNQAKNAAGSTALDSLFAPELEHLQNKNKPSMNAMQAQRAGTQAPTNPGMFSFIERRGCELTVIYKPGDPLSDFTHHSLRMGENCHVCPLQRLQFSREILIAATMRSKSQCMTCQNSAIKFAGDLQRSLVCPLWRLLAIFAIGV